MSWKMRIRSLDSQTKSLISSIDNEVLIMAIVITGFTRHLENMEFSFVVFRSRPGIR